MKGIDTQQIDGVINLMINSLNSAGVEKFSLSVGDGHGKMTIELKNGDWYMKSFVLGVNNEKTVCSDG